MRPDDKIMQQFRNAGKPREEEDDGKDYPGNTPPRNRKGGVHVERGEDAKREFSPQVYLVNGEEKNFYSIGAVAAIFGRKPVTIRSWEDKGIIPRPKFRTPKPKGVKSGPNTKGRRLYSQNQVEYLMLLSERYNMVDVSKADWDGFQQAMSDYPKS